LNIKLYIGAHKTATTHIQKLLDANREKLIANNIKLSTPDDLRGRWLPALYKYSNLNDTNYLRAIRSECPEKGTWIVAEENISGTSYELKTHSGIYPNLKSRLYTIKNIFKDDNIEIFFSIRSYECFYRSAYLEVVRNRGYTPFSEFYDERRYENNSWVDVLDIFSSIVPEENIMLWCYEDFREIMPDVLRGLTGLDSVDEFISGYNVETTRPSLSKKTVEVLASLHPVISQTESLQLVERINSAYASSDYFMPFSKGEIEKFQDKYKADVSIIRNKYPNIKFLDT
jgi:hypothetical protein